MQSPHVSHAELDRFHSLFRGDTAITFSTCVACGGVCEQKAITCLLPGEAEYIAAKHGQPLQQFRDQCLDGILVDGELIDVTKCTKICPMLNNASGACGLRGYKPVLCLIYPLLFEPVAGGWRYYMDRDCPLSRREDTRRYFEEDGANLARQLLTDHVWLRRVYIFDQYIFDYHQFEAIRNCPSHEYRIFTIDEILACRRQALTA